MKSYRNALGALALAFVFSTSTFAEGVIWIDRTLSPPSPPVQAEGIMYTDIAAPVLEDTLMEIALSLLQTLIPLV
jgi:hypothetical protein